MTIPRIRNINRLRSSIVILCLMALFQDGRSRSLFEYSSSHQKFSSDVLKTNLVKGDFNSHVKVLPEQQPVVFQLTYGQEIKLLYPVAKASPITLSLSPCYGAIKWTLLWRPYIVDGYDVTSGAVAGDRHPQGDEAPMSDAIVNEEVVPTNSSRYRRSRYRHREKKSKKIRLKYGTNIIQNNFSTPDVQNPRLRFVFNEQKSILEMEITFGGGKDPWIFERDVAKPGLYILKIQSTSQHSKFHALASRQSDVGGDSTPELKVASIRKHSRGHSSISLSWSGSVDNRELFCLVVSRQKLYSSLCAARDLQLTWKQLRSAAADTSLILGCTFTSQYDFPVTPNDSYYVTIWKQESLIPFVQATVRAKPHRKVTRLKSGLMVPFTLMAGGQVEAKFNVRKEGRKLHVAAVSCSGGIKVVVSAGKERVASAEGMEALHLMVRRPPKDKLTITVSPVPPLQALYRVHLVASHSSRRLPIPRIPKNVTVHSEYLNCSSARIQWRRAHGGASYCIIFRHHPSGRPPEIRPPIQCGWEHVIQRPDYFEVLQCFNGTKDSVQEHIVSNLQPGSYLINVLVRHPYTGKTLALAPSMLSIPPCLEDNLIFNER